MNTEHPASGKVLDTALLIAGTTALAYAVAFSYESAYCTHFGVPSYLISPTTAVLVAAVAGVLFTAMNAMPLLAMVRHQFHRRGIPTQARFRIELTAFFVFVVFAMGGFNWFSALLALLPLIVFLGEYIPAFFMRGTLGERLAAIDKIPDPVAEHHPLNQFLAAVDDRRVTRFVILGLVAYFGAMATGSFNARSQTEFQVIASRPDVALLKAYGDIFVGIKFDEEAKKSTGEVIVFKISDDFKELHLVKKRIGPLAKATR